MELSCGLQTFNESGKVIVDTSSRIQKYLGKLSCAENIRECSQTNQELEVGDLWWLVVPESYPENRVRGNSSATYTTPSVYKTGQTIFCKWDGDHAACDILYGVY